MRLRFAWIALLGLSACAADTDVGGRGIALRDPLGLIDDVYASGNDLRLYVLPADAYACVQRDDGSRTGDVLPAPPDSPPGEFEDAIVDISLTRDDVGRREVMVPIGQYTVFVRGKGTDVVSGEMNTVIARGCSTTGEIGEGSTIDVSVRLEPVTGMGICGNTVLSPDEQCETTLPECTPECRTRVEAINTTTAAPQNRVRIAARSGERVITAWDSDATSVSVRLLDESARALTGLGPLATDRPLDDLGPLPGSQSSATPAVAPDGRVAIALVDFPAGDTDVRVGFFSDTLTQMGTYAQARTDRAMRQTSPALAFHSSGSLMVVFQDMASSTGLSARIFDAGATTPSGAEASAIGNGQTGGTLPAIAALPAGFVVAFAASGGVFYQRFGMDGAPVDATAQPVDDAAGTRDQPTVAALADGTFLVAWAEANAPGDAMGQGIRARIVGADGTPVGAAFIVNDTIAGDQTHPSAIGAAGRFLVAFQSGAAVRGRVISSSGDPLLNRERPPSLGDFEIAPTGARPSAAVIGTGVDQAWWIAWEGPGDASDIFARRYLL